MLYTYRSPVSIQSLMMYTGFKYMTGIDSKDLFVLFGLTVDSIGKLLPFLLEI